MRVVTRRRSTVIGRSSARRRRNNSRNRDKDCRLLKSNDLTRSIKKQHQIFANKNVAFFYLLNDKLLRDLNDDSIVVVVVIMSVMTLDDVLDSQNEVRATSKVLIQMSNFCS